MQRDIENYTQKYLDSNFNDFETYMVGFRRAKVLEILESYRPLKLLEIGCGMDSIANHYTSFEQCVIIEPSQVFANKAKEDTIFAPPPPKNRSD